MNYLTITQVAERLQLSVPTIKRYIYDGRLRSVKLPGGQHRIPDSEIHRLLAAHPLRDDETAPGGKLRQTLLERRLSELQAEVERLQAALSVLSRVCARHSQTHSCARRVPQGAKPARVQVLGPGCRRCRELYRLTVATLKDLGRDDVLVQHTRDLDDIAEFGPVLTPAIAVNGEVVLSGRVPSQRALRQLLRAHSP